MTSCDQCPVPPLRGTASLLALSALLLAGVAGCGDSGTNPGGVPEITALPRALTQSEVAVIEGSNRFAFDLLRSVLDIDGSGNAFLSPLSASMALGMTMNGAAGETLEGMRATLGFGGLPLSEVNVSYRGLIDLLLGLDDTVELGIGNSIWVREGFAVEPPFLAVGRDIFGAEVSEADFDDPEAVNAINAWVRRETNGRIDEIVGPSIDAAVVMLLINAIYFKGSWTVEFDGDRTESQGFTRADGSTVTVPLMRVTDAFSYTEIGGAQVVDLPYGGKAFSMTVVLPPPATELSEYARGLDAPAWAAMVAALPAPGEGTVLLPRFRLEYERVLNDVLQGLGMSDAFDPNVADFSGINASARELELHISKVKQKTFVEVNEEGTEAAAATSVEVGVTSCCSGFEMRVDRPFLFAIRERLSGTILFLGAVSDPTATGG